MTYLKNKNYKNFKAWTFFVVGFLLAIGIGSVFAAPILTVSPGDTLTSTLWNDMANKVNALQIKKANCAWTANVVANRPNWAVATCPGTKKLVGHHVYISSNTDEDWELEVMDTFVRARRVNDGTSATVSAYCCDVTVE